MGKQSKEHAEIRTNTLAAFAKGGSVFVDGKFVTQQKDLPTDHPARYDDEGPAEGGESGQGDALLLSRIVELEAHCKAAIALSEASDASRVQAETALDAVKRERDDLQRQLDELKAANPLQAEKTSEGSGQPVQGTLVPAGGTGTLTVDEDGTSTTKTSTPLPADFPKREQLLAVGIDTVEAVAAKSVDELNAVEGITSKTAGAVKEAALAALGQAG